MNKSRFQDACALLGGAMGQFVQGASKNMRIHAREEGKRR